MINTVEITENWVSYDFMYEDIKYSRYFNFETINEFRQVNKRINNIIKSNQYADVDQFVKDCNFIVEFMSVLSYAMNCLTDKERKRISRKYGNFLVQIVIDQSLVYSFIQRSCYNNAGIGFQLDYVRGSSCFVNRFQMLGTQNLCCDNFKLHISPTTNSELATLGVKENIFTIAVSKALHFYEYLEENKIELMTIVSDLVTGKDHQLEHSVQNAELKAMEVNSIVNNEVSL